MVKEHLNTKCPKLGKISLAKTLSKCSILENPQFGRVSGCCSGYCDNFCDWWVQLSALVRLQVSDYRCPITANCPITTLHND